MSGTDIALWSSSLTLAIIGIMFGVIASYNSNKANHKLRDLIATNWSQTVAQKLFFYELKNLIKENKKIIHLVEQTEDLTYEVYSINSSHTRFNPISESVSTTFKDSRYKKTLKIYTAYKTESDQSFFHVIPDTEILGTNKAITKKVKHQLISHHNLTIKLAREIIVSYLNANQEV